MKVILAQPRGFCAGVVRAIEIVERALEKYGAPVYVRHEIVHNKWRGRRAEGAQGAVSSRIWRKCRRTADHHLQRPWRRQDGRAGRAGRAACTCSTPPARWSPRCTPRAGTMSRKGRTVILIGHAGHPEVEGHARPDRRARCCWCRTRRTSRSSTCRRIRRSPMSRRRRSASTTREGIIAALKRRFTDIVGPGHRGHLLRDAEPPDGRARTAQAGRRDPRGRRANSSNSNRLREIGAGSRYSDLPDRRRQRDRSGMGATASKSVGITAGASAPGSHGRRM